MPATTTKLTGSNAIEQGADWSHGWAVTYNGVAVNATWTARSQVRAYAGAPGSPLHQFTASVNSDGSVVIGMSAAESTAASWRQGAYDVEITNAGGTVHLRVAQGPVEISAEVTV